MTGNELYEEYCNEYPLIMGYREVSYESWLQRQVLELRENVVNKNCNLPHVSNLMPELEKIVSSRIKDAFDNGMQNYEKNELQAALYTIKRLVPPSYFEGICC